MSAAHVSGDAPSLSSPFVPHDSAEVISPGTANTSRPSSSARSAVISAPLRSRASTTTVAAARPATILLRAGKRHGAGATPGAYSATISPRRRDPARELRVRGRIVAVDPAAEHGDRRAARVERTAVRFGVDAACEPADDDEARARDARGRASAPRMRRNPSRRAHRRSQRQERRAARRSRRRGRTARAADRESRAAAAETVPTTATRSESPPQRAAARMPPRRTRADAPPSASRPAAG